MTALPFKTDSYKVGHWNMYPENMTHMFSYLESRKGSKELGDSIVVFGTRYYMEMLQDSLDDLKSEDSVYDNFFKLAEAHGEIPNKEGWEDLFNSYICKGMLPIKIKALPEGIIVKPGTMVMSIENTDERFPWLVNYLETWLMNIWYPMTVASKSYSVRKLLENHYVRTGCDVSGIDFSYHNFGSRSSVCSEAAVIGGMAHLTCFSGTDNFESIPMVQSLYDTVNGVIGYSIPATEHSVMCSWGKDNEFDCVENYLEKHKNSPIIACVADTYNVFNFVNVVTNGKFKEKIESEDYPIFVIRPDSGEPISVLRRIINIMEKNQVLYSTNDKGFKVWNKYRIIWGDGITPKNIDNILSAMSDLGYAASNFAFGSGGDLMQNVSRDTFGFALKASAVKYSGSDDWIGISKNPVTDSGKKSKEGKLMTIKWTDPKWHVNKAGDGLCIQTIKESDFDPELHEDAMEVIFDGSNKMVNGEFPKVV